MKLTLIETLTAFVLLVGLLCNLPQGFSASFTISYQLLNHADGSQHYRLTVAISESLHAYYVEKTHRLNSYTDFAGFVTPYALEPISDRMWEIYGDSEDFANGALMLVHQIPYKETTPVKFPVETIVDNEGDCDLFSYIAASIIKAGGLDVVLLYYEGEAHMNIGVNLPNEPRDARERPHYVTHGGAKFYIAECTGGAWLSGWRVGECPDTLANADIQIITLENCETVSPGQVSASLNNLEVSAVSLSISSGFLIQGSAVTFSGQLTPSAENETITIYIKANNVPWTVLGTATTNSNGRFAYSWNADVSGICYVRASWSGTDVYAAADSQTYTLTVLSLFFVALIGLTAALGGAGVIVYLISRHSKSDIPEPAPPEISV